MRIVIIGANGQVASEVALLLTGIAGVEIVPVSRTRNGSAFLRSRGVAVWHGSVTDPESAKAMLAGADVVANFALAGGTGKEAVEANNAIIQAVQEHSPLTSRLIFFSTLAAEGIYDAKGQKVRNAYGDLKRRNEHHFASGARQANREGWALRLGHVCGDQQNITIGIRAEIEAGEVVLPDPQRLSNTTHVAAIAEAILAIGEGRTAGPGLYDLISTPHWSWQQVYAYEAKQIGKPLNLSAAAPGAATVAQSVFTRAKGLAFSTIDRLGIRPVLERGLVYLPGDFIGRTKIAYTTGRARQEIAALQSVSITTNSAAFWPGLSLNALPGLRDTLDLLETGVFSVHGDLSPWPQDLA